MDVCFRFIDWWVYRACRGSNRNGEPCGGKQMKPNHPGYLARNMDVCNAVGLCSNLNAMYERLRGKSYAPQWLVIALEDMIHKADCLSTPLIRYRDEISPYLNKEVK